MNCDAEAMGLPQFHKLIPELVVRFQVERAYVDPYAAKHQGISTRAPL
jgi:hypothetical protein